MKIYIIGTSGSGKTTLAKALENKLSLNHIELDTLYWLPNWVESPIDAFVEKVKFATQGNNWVVCGNYRPVKGHIMEQADFIVWLDYPFWRVFSQVFRRTVRNIATKKNVAGGNYETFCQQFFTKKSIFLWVIQTHWKRRQSYSRMMAEGQYKDKWVKISTPQEYEAFILQMEKWRFSRNLEKNPTERYR